MEDREQRAMSRPMDVYEELVELRRTGQKAALATIIEVTGSIPSFQSAKMLVREDGSMVGTIGGGCTEAEVWNAAREVMATEKPKMLSFNLGQDAAYDQGLICGGQLNVYVEPILPIPSCFIFGAGHISKSLSKIATQAGFRTVIIDNRDTYANRERFPEAAEIFAGEYEEVFPKLHVNDSSFFIIVTRGHKDDMRVLRWAVTQPARYLGMIGSKRKTIEVVKHLRREGIAVEKFAKLHAPMGFDIGAVTPEEIAVSVVAEMIQRRRNPGAKWNPLSKSIFAEGIPKAVQVDPLPGSIGDESGARPTATLDKTSAE
jgi:xanthine dehydrogenase accessory factor